MQREKPDIAFVATQSELPNIFPICMECIEAKANVITIAEEAFYPWLIESERGALLDDACKANGVTMYACGIQDVFGSAIPMALAASCNRVDRFHGYNFQPLEDMGPVVAEGFYVGQTIEEANEELAKIPDVGNPETRVFLGYSCRLQNLRASSYDDTNDCRCASRSLRCRMPAVGHDGQKG